MPLKYTSMLDTLMTTPLNGLLLQLPPFVYAFGSESVDYQGTRHSNTSHIQTPKQTQTARSSQSHLQVEPYALVVHVHVGHLDNHILERPAGTTTTTLLVGKIPKTS
jgi:hypothetical protein